MLRGHSVFVFEHALFIVTLGDSRQLSTLQLIKVNSWFTLLAKCLTLPVSRMAEHSAAGLSRIGAHASCMAHDGMIGSSI